MGCDIHLVIEKQDILGDWHAIWNSSLDYTDWAESKLSENGINLLNSEISWLSGRDYNLFAALSGVRGECLINIENLGDKGMLLDFFPKDITKKIEPAIFKDRDIHSKGHLYLKDINLIKTQLEFYLTLNQDKFYSILNRNKKFQSQQNKILLDWINNLKFWIDILLDKEILGYFIGDKEFFLNIGHIKDIDIQKGDSNHQKLLFSDLWRTKPSNHENTVRVLIGYDS